MPNKVRKQIAAGVLMLIAVGTMAGCCHYRSPAGEGGLIGSWKFKDSYQGNQVLTFRSGGNYQVDFDGDGQKDSWGTYHLNWNEITFLQKGGKIGEACEAEGRYNFTLAGGELNFRLISDACTSRVKAFTMLWVRG